MVKGDAIEFGFAAVLDQLVVDVPVICRHNLIFDLGGEHIHEFLSENVGQNVLKEVDDEAGDFES